MSRILEAFHGTTIVSVRKGGKVAIGGDGQVTFGPTIVKANAKKVRRLGNGEVIGGFAGATADALTLFDRLEKKLEQHRGQLARACVELAKDWRTDRYLRRLDAMMLVADKEVTSPAGGHRRCAGAGKRGRRHRLGRALCARCRPRADRTSLDAEAIVRDRSKSQPKSASTPTAISSWRRSEGTERFFSARDRL